MTTIAVVDYGMGNLRSVARALEQVASASMRVRITADATAIRAADRVVFPGQGAARDCMQAIDRQQLREPLIEAARNRPFFGMCMGLQVLLDFSDESGGTDCLGLLPGAVHRFPEGRRDMDGRRLKVPHMGWNAVRQTRDHPLWAGVSNGAYFYFVHSYHAVPDDAGLIAGETDYGNTFCSVVARDNLFACQFHPEKSSGDGLQLLQNFVNWDGTTPESH